MEVNGRTYTLWGQFVKGKADWIGGILHDKDKDVPAPETIITDIELLPHGEDSAFFWVRGKDYDCGFHVEHGGVSGEHVENGLMLGGIIAFSIQRSPSYTEDLTEKPVAPED